MKVFEFAKGAVQQANNLEDAITKSQQVFKGLSGDIETFSDGSAKAFGLAKAEALDALGTIGNLTQSLGIAAGPAAEMSKSIVQLAGDIASMEGSTVSVQDALVALRAGLSGETEPLKRFGVVLSEQALKEKALSLGLIKTAKGVLPIAIKTQAAYALIMAKTVTTQGDYARTSGSLANMQRTLAGEFKNVQARLGTALIPAMKTLVGIVQNSLLPAFEGLFALLGTSGGKLLLLAGAFVALRKAMALVAATKLGGLIASLNALAFQQGAMFALTDTLRTVGLRFRALLAAVTPFHAALAVGAIILVKYLDRKKAVAAASLAFADALKAEATGAKDATRELIAKSLADKGAFELAKRMAIPLDVLTSATLGQADALKIVAEKQREYLAAAVASEGGAAQRHATLIVTKDNVVRLREAMGFLTATTVGGVSAQKDMDAAIRGTGGATTKALAPTSAFAAAMKRVADEGQRVKTKTDAARDALDSLLGPSLNAEQAADNFTTKIRALGEALKGSKSGLRGNSEAALAAREALREAVRGAQDLAAGTGSTRGALIAQIRAMQTLSNTSPQVAAKLAPLIAKLKALVKVPTVDKAAAAKAGADIAAGIAAGMKSGEAVVEQRARQLAAAAIAAARAKLEERSPSKVFMRIGQNIVAGLVEGIKGKSGMSIAAIKTLFDKLKEQAQSMRDSIAQGIGGGTDIVSSLGGVSMLGGDNVNAFFQQAIAKAKEFGARLRQLAKAGLNQGLLQRLASAGPDALPLIRAIQQAGVGRISSFQNQIDNIINQTGRAIAPFPTLGVAGAGGNTIRVEVILNEKVLGVAIAELDRKTKRGRR